ncbi:MAG: UDP-N-acetylglucosamine 2-epimerase (hydrolyzing) [Phycisphaerales bacterium]|nr:UDP-N-acetylglucosamine 2-epimerase (hydrolyzing) [Phycisphaerales bacterium]
MMPRPPRHRRIAVITGTRAEYGLLRTTIRAVQRHPRLQLQLVATGMHLVRKFGSTVRQIEADGFRVAARVPMQRGTDDALDQAEGLARGVRGIARFLREARSDIVLVLGDRIEAMAGALAGVTTGRIVAHVHGGDVAPGDLDDALRHAITKLAHLHLPATRASMRRVVRMGERREHVFLVGAPGLDELASILRAHARAPQRSGHALIVHHPCGRSAKIEARVMRDLLASVERHGLRRLIVYPNSDRGHQGVIRAIRDHAARSRPGEVSVFRSLPRDEFVRCLSAADVLVGNSSSGIIEAPFVGTPSVNVGARQTGREPGGASVIHVDENSRSISAALARALRTRNRRPAHSVYGDGHAGRKIAEILASIEISEELRRKQIAWT